MLFKKKEIVQHIIAKACQEPRWNLICARGGVSLEQVSGLKEFFERGKRNFPILERLFVQGQISPLVKNISLSCSIPPRSVKLVSKMVEYQVGPLRLVLDFVPSLVIQTRRQSSSALLLVGESLNALSSPAVTHPHPKPPQLPPFDHHDALVRPLLLECLQEELLLPQPLLRFGQQLEVIVGPEGGELALYVKFLRSCVQYSLNVAAVRSGWQRVDSCLNLM